MASLHQAAHDEGKMNDRAHFAHFARFVLQSFFFAWPSVHENAAFGPLMTICGWRYLQGWNC